MARSSLNPTWSAIRITDMSGGRNTLIPRDALEDNESPESTWVDFSLKGIARPATGRRARFAAPFAAAGINGVGAYYKRDGTSRLLAGVGGSLYADTPHLVLTYDTQADWQKGQVSAFASTTASPGDVTLNVVSIKETVNKPFQEVGTGDPNLAFGDGIGFNPSSTTRVDPWSGTTSQGGASNYAYFTPITVSSPIIVTRVWWYNFDGIRNAAPRIYRISDKGLVATGGFNIVSRESWWALPLDTSVVLVPGETYLVGVYVTNATNATIAPITNITTNVTKSVAGADITWLATGTYHDPYDRYPTQVNSTPNIAAFGLEVGSSWAPNAQGTWTSNVIDIGFSQLAAASLSVTTTIPSGASVTVKVRTSADKVEWSAWQTLDSTGGVINNPQRYIQVQITLSMTTTPPFVTGLSLTVDEQVSGFWVSDVIDVSNASDKTSGKVATVEDRLGGDTVAWFSRSLLADGTSWSEWTPINVDGSLASPASDKVQLQAKITMNASHTTPPKIKSLTLSYDGTPSMTLLASNWTSGGTFRFETLKDVLIVCNGIDSPRKYDGTTLSPLGGNPPVFAYVKAHRNRLWAAGDPANPSRLYFSDLLDVESWPALNFIDINPDDGDRITGLQSYAGVLVVTKEHSVWIVTGDSIQNFAVQRVHEGLGCIAPDSLVAFKNYLGFVSVDGMYFTDLNEAVLATERVKHDWEKTNPHKRHLAAAGYDPRYNMLYLAVPGENDNHNTVLFVYDVLRNAWDIRHIPVSGMTVFREAGRDIFWLASSEEGQIWALDSPTDLGELVPFVWETKAFSIDNTPERTKFFGRVILQVRTDTPCTIAVSFRVDLGALTNEINVSVPGDGKMHTAIVWPRSVGAVKGRYLSVRVRNTTVGARPELHSIAIESLPVDVRSA